MCPIYYYILFSVNSMRYYCVHKQCDNKYLSAAEGRCRGDAAQRSFLDPNPIANCHFETPILAKLHWKLPFLEPAIRTRTPNPAPNPITNCHFETPFLAKPHWKLPFLEPGTRTRTPNLAWLNRQFVCGSWGGRSAGRSAGRTFPIFC